jgi:2'-5' RNA ligase
VISNPCHWHDFPPSPRTLWELTQIRPKHAMMFPNDRKSSVVLWCQKRSGEPLRQLAKSSRAELAEFELPRQACAVVPISIAIADVTKRLAQLVGNDKASGQ